MEQVCIIPVATMSSTTMTFCPCLIASFCIWKKSDPYSFSKLAVSVGPGSFPFFLTGTKPAPILNARLGPKRKPLASRPRMRSGLLLVPYASMMWSSRARMRLSCKVGSWQCVRGLLSESGLQRHTLKIGSMSSNNTPFVGKSGNWRSACFSFILRLPHVSTRRFVASGRNTGTVRRRRLDRMVSQSTYQGDGWLLTGRGGGLSCLGGGIWTGWMLSSVVCHGGRRERMETSNSRYRASLTAYKEKKESNGESACETRSCGLLDWVVGNRDKKCQSG